MVVCIFMIQLEPWSYSLHTVNFYLILRSYSMYIYSVVIMNNKKNRHTGTVTCPFMCFY